MSSFWQETFVRCELQGRFIRRGPQISKLTPSFNASFQDAGSSVGELNKRSARRAVSMPFNLNDWVALLAFQRVSPSIKKNLECQTKCCFLAFEPRIMWIARIAQIAVFLCLLPWVSGEQTRLL